MCELTKLFCVDRDVNLKSVSELDYFEWYVKNKTTKHIDKV